MAALGPVVTRSDGKHTTFCSHRSLPLRKQAWTCKLPRFCLQPLRTHRPLQRHCELFHRGTSRVQAQAAGEIALPGPGGHAEDVVLPEPGLLNPSVLNSEYDSEIFGLAIPALGSILLDPFLSLVDTGKTQLHSTCIASSLASGGYKGFYSFAVSNL